MGDAFELHAAEPYSKLDPSNVQCNREDREVLQCELNQTACCVGAVRGQRDGEYAGCNQEVLSDI
jgi:hypothetical protein